MLIGDMLALAGSCVALPPCDLCVPNPAGMALCPVDCAVPDSAHLVIKRSRLPSTCGVFSAAAVADSPEFSFPKVADAAVTDPMKTLVVTVYARRHTQLKFGAVRDDALATIARGFTAADVARLPEAEQSSLLFVLLGSHLTELVPATLHRRIVAAMQQRSDVAKFQELVPIVLQMPVETHVVLSQLGWVFGGVLADEDTRVRAVRLTVEMLFEVSIDRHAEVNFVSFLFVCAHWVFMFPERPRLQLRRFGEQLVFFDGSLSLTFEGLQQFTIPRTEPFPIPTFDAFFKDNVKPPDEVGAAIPALAELGARATAARLDVTEKLRLLSAQPFKHFTVDDIFAPH
jgi:hypothetical protein